MERLAEKLEASEARVAELSAEVGRWKNNADNERLRADEAEAEWTNWREQAKMYEQQMGVQAERAEASEARVRALEEALRTIFDDPSNFLCDKAEQVCRAALGVFNG